MKHVLFDENMPRQLRRDLPEFEIRTVQEQRWSSLENGDLLRAAQTRFEVLVTADKRLQFQQNVTSFNIAIVVVDARSTRLIHMRPLVPRLKLAIQNAIAGTVSVVAAG